MSGLKSAGSQDSEREIMASKTEHWEKQSVFPAIWKKKIIYKWKAKI